MKKINKMLLFITFTISNIVAQELIDYSSEISRLRKELVRLQSEKQRTQDDTKKEKKDADSYYIKSSKRMSDIRNEIESIKLTIKTTKVKKDSLDIHLNQLLLTQKQISLNQGELSEAIINSCILSMNFINKLPPLIALKLRSSLGLLISEIRDKNIDNIEAVTRFTKIIEQIDEYSKTVQVDQQNSPYPEINGTVYRLRIGNFFEALVDLKGERCALWVENKNEIPTWKMTNNETAQFLYKSIQIREGKSLPAFGMIPFKIIDTLKGK